MPTYIDIVHNGGKVGSYPQKKCKTGQKVNNFVDNY